MDDDDAKVLRGKVPALARAVQILDFISASDQRLTVSEISRQTGLPKSTAHGICMTLVHHEILQKRDDQSFKIGPHVMRWSNAFIRRTDVTDEFLTIWDSEANLAGTTITLSGLDGTDVVYIAVRNSGFYSGFFNFSIGTRLPAAFTATGKAFLMSMSDHDVKRLYADGLPPALTAHSVQDLDVLLDELGRFRAIGYSIDNEQVKEGMRCFGKTVLNSLNAPIAGVAVSVPADPMTADKEHDIVISLSSISEKISRRMGADVSKNGSKPSD